MSEDPEIEALKRLLANKNRKDFMNMRNLLTKLRNVNDERAKVEQELATLTTIDDNTKLRFLAKYDEQVARIMNELERIAFTDEN